MSIWQPDHKSAVEGSSEFIPNLPKKAYTKIDPTSKLQVIQALDNGQCKLDIAKEYGIHPHLITFIYKQKDAIIKKYTDKYDLLKQACNLNLEQKLLDWFEQQFRSGNIITEDILFNKTKDLLKESNQEVTCTDDWLYNFQMRHNISKHVSDKMCSEKANEDWRRLLTNGDPKDIYLGSVCALAHNLDLINYLNGQGADSYVSTLCIVNILGTDKREVVIVGKETLVTEAHVKSLPVKYYYCANSQFNYSVIISYLSKWNSDLAVQGKYITLVLNIPDSFIAKVKFENIRILNTTSVEYVIHVFEKLVECFKFHYRKLLISRAVTYGKDNATFVDQLHMVAVAWYNVSCKYVQNLCLPPVDGSLYFKEEHGDDDHSISQWCKLYNIPINVEESSTSLDKYISCDKNLPFLQSELLDDNLQATEVLTVKDCQSTSGMEAYQAMKRIVSYLQGENAGASIMKYAKYLENHIEYGALLEMHQIIASTNGSME